MPEDVGDFDITIVNNPSTPGRSPVLFFTDTHHVPPALAQGEGEALAVPTYQQLNGYNCGLIAGVSLIETFHPEDAASVERFIAEIDTTPDGGTTTKELLGRLKKHGVGTTKARGALTMAKIARSIDEGFPILTSAVLLETHNDGSPKVIHWVIIYGYTFDHAYVYVANSSWGAFRSRQKIRWEDFRSKLVPSRHPNAACWTCHGLAVPKKKSKSKNSKRAKLIRPPRLH